MLLDDQSSLDRWLAAGGAPDSLAAQPPFDDAQPPVSEISDPAKDHPDPGGSARRSLVALIRAGDPDAAAGFYEARVEKVRSYCAKACPWELIDRACEASLVEFVARVRADSEPDLDLEDLLLKATRAAAAGRFDLASSAAAAPPRQGTGATCAAMPELLAAEANRELFKGNEAVRVHVQNCPACRATAARMKQAEDAFAQATGWEPSAQTGSA